MHDNAAGRGFARCIVPLQIGATSVAAQFMRWQTGSLTTRPRPRFDLLRYANGANHSGFVTETALIIIITCSIVAAVIRRQETGRTMRSTDSALVAEHGTEADTLTRYRQVLRQRLLLIGVLVLAILASVILDFTLGPAGLTLNTLWQTLLHPAAVDAGTRVIVWDIRLPYALMAVVVGFSLGLAGAEMQTILNNPLASRLRSASRRQRRLVPRWRSFLASVFPACRTSG